MECSLGKEQVESVCEKKSVAGGESGAACLAKEFSSHLFCKQQREMECMMVNFMCHVALTKGCPQELVKRYFWVCGGRCFWRRPAFDS